jgi:biopolymer transport protein ExbB
MGNSRALRTFSCWLVIALSLPAFAVGQQDDPIDIAAGPSGEQHGFVVIENDDISATADDKRSEESLSLLWLVGRGGWMMLPIYLASIVMITVIIERALGLRRFKVMPPQLVNGLVTSGSESAGLDPRRAYRMCQRHPSPTATVIRTMLLKVGRPHAEVERAVAEVSQREADRMYANVRWLNLVAAVAPLLGLLGTVWGMIRAFFDTTQLQVGQNKADFLASGIYVALVTTLGGLAVAIPAAIFAHFFEGRIQNIFRKIEELLFNLLPHVERFEGRLRMNPAGALDVENRGLDEENGLAHDESVDSKVAPTSVPQ